MDRTKIYIFKKKKKSQVHINLAISNLTYGIFYFFDFTLFFPFPYIKKLSSALVGVAQWIEHGGMNQRVTGSIPSKGTCLDHTLMFLSLSFSVPSPLSKNK